MKKEFIQQISNGLFNCQEFCKIQLANTKIACAVSGGADSVSLLLALNELKQNFNFELCAISVNHNLRGQESLGDLKYVEELCANLKINCISITVPDNQIEQLANCRKGGIEEAARFVRYKEFEQAAAQYNINFIALAHNKNDVLENILMRFMQGGLENLDGMKICRPFAFGNGFYIRPMTEVFRSEVEEFLAFKKIEFRTDSSNLEDNFLRNKMRHNVVPVLEDNFKFWQMGAISSAYKSRVQKETVDFYAEQEIKNINLKKEFTEDYKKITFDGEKFDSLLTGVKWSIIYSVLNQLEVGNRFPFARVQEVGTAGVNSNYKLELNLQNGTLLQINSGKIFEFVVVQNGASSQNIRTKRDFSVIIKDSGSFKLGEIEFLVEKNIDGCGGVKLRDKNSTNQLFLPSLDFPFVVRSRNPGDKIKCSNGTFKNVKDAVAGLKKLEECLTFDSKNVLVIQELSSADLNIVALWGTFGGLCNWIV